METEAALPNLPILPAREKGQSHHLMGHAITSLSIPDWGSAWLASARGRLGGLVREEGKAVG